MNEIMSLMNRDISGWMCSGDDEAVTAIVFKNLLYKAAEQHFVQVVIASEDMLPAVSQIVESDSRNKGYLPSYAHRYLWILSMSGEMATVRLWKNEEAVVIFLMKRRHQKNKLAIHYPHNR